MHFSQSFLEVKKDEDEDNMNKRSYDKNTLHTPHTPNIDMRNDYNDISPYIYNGLAEEDDVNLSGEVQKTILHNLDPVEQTFFCDGLEDKIKKKYTNKPKSLVSTSTIPCVTLSFRAIKSLKKKGGLPISGAKVLLWVSHGNSNYDNVDNIRALADAFYKIFEAGTELEIVVTGYLNRHNYYNGGKSDEATADDLKGAIKKGMLEQQKWIEMTKDEGAFGDVKHSIIDWKDCIDSSKNEYYSVCMPMIQERFSDQKSNLYKGIEKTATTYVDKHFEFKKTTRIHNSKQLLIEECAWLASLRLQGYTHIIYFGEKTPAIKAVFNDNEFALNKSIMWMHAKISNVLYNKLGSFQFAYINEDNRYHGFSYAIEQPRSVSKFIGKIRNKNLPKKNIPSDFFAKDKMIKTMPQEKLDPIKARLTKSTPARRSIARMFLKNRGHLIDENISHRKKEINDIVFRFLNKK